MIKRKIFQIALFSLIAVNLYANSLISNKYPFGLPSRKVCASSMYMGGASTGLPDAHNVLIANPGNLGQIKTTAFTGILNIDYVRIKDSGKYSDMINTYPGLLAFSIPIGKFGTLGFGMNKDNIIEVNADSKVLNSDGDLTRVSNHITGGTNSWEAGWGISPFKQLSLGLSLQRIYFKKEDTFIQELNDKPWSRDSSSTMLRTYGLTFGYMGTFKDLTAGVSYRHFIKQDGRIKSNIYNYTSSDQELSTPISETDKVKYSDIQMPSELSFGLSYKINKSITTAADLSLTLWQTYKDNSQILSGTSNSYNDQTIATSFGVSFIPKPNLLYPKYWEIIDYMVGFRFNQMPDKNDFEIAGTGGLSFPLKNAGQLQFGFEAGSRVLGTPPSGSSEYKENFVSFMIGLSGGKRWRKSSDETY